MKKWIKNKYLATFVLNSCFFITAFLFNEIKYEVSDDFVMETILSGAYGGEINPHMLFVNVLYGYVLKGFYLLLPTLNWYTISLLFWGFIACMGFAVFLCKLLDYKRAIFFDFIFLVAFSNDIYILLQFTKTAALCCSIGALLIMQGLFGEKKEREKFKVIINRSELVLGIVLCVVGSWIRMNVVYLIALFVLIIVFYEYSSYVKTFFDNKECRRVLVKKTLICFGIVAVVFGCYGINRISYNTNADYKYYSQYAKVRAAIVDSVDYGYEEYAEEFTKIRISENDYYMLRKWNFSDPEYFTIEKLQKIANIIQEHNHSKKIDWQKIYDQYQERKYTSYPICMACIIITILCVLWNAKKWKWYGITWACTAFLIIYFFVRGRVLYRLEYGIFLCTFLALIYLSLDDLKGILEDKNSVIMMLIISFCCIAMHVFIHIPDFRYVNVKIEERKWYIDDTYNASWNYDVRKYRKVLNRSDLSYGLINEMSAHPENTYLLDFNSTIQSLYYDWSAFDSLGKGYYTNYCYLSGVTMNFPDVNNCLKNMGISNPIKDLVNDNVYLVDIVNYEKIETYLREHYYPNVELKWIDNVEGYDIWKILAN